MPHPQFLNQQRDTSFPCPGPSEWWFCSTDFPTFLGCCTTDPCGGGGCPQHNLYPAELGPGGAIAPNHACPSGAKWWTCADQTPTFQGCCKSDPCNGIGCPSDDLVAAEVFAGLPSGWTTASPPPATVTPDVAAAEPTTVSIASGTETSTDTALTASTTATSSSPSAATATTSPHPSPPIGLIAGTAASGAILFLLLLVLAIFLLHKRRSSNHPVSHHKYDDTTTSSDTKKSQIYTLLKQSPSPMGHVSPPPVYGFHAHPNSTNESLIAELPTPGQRPRPFYELPSPPESPELGLAKGDGASPARKSPQQGYQVHSRTGSRDERTPTSSGGVGRESVVSWQSLDSSKGGMGTAGTGGAQNSSPSLSPRGT